MTAYTKAELTDRTKLVYVLNRNAEGKLFPSSPLEAHKNHALVTNIIGVDQVSCHYPNIGSELIMIGLRQSSVCCS